MRFRATILLFMVAALPAVAEPPRPPAGKVDRNAPDYVRCERRAPIGSMIKSVKICRTNAEWRAIIEQQGGEAANFVERNRGMPSTGS